MKIYVTSDTHNKKMPFFEEGKYDLVLHCGDITDYGFNEFNIDLLKYYRNLKTPVMFTPGNHDLCMKGVDTIGENIERKVVTKEGLSFLGMSCCPAYNMPCLATKWDFTTINLLAEEAYYSSLPYADIVLSHCPPRYGKLDITYSGTPIGSTYLLEYIKLHQPKYVFCGHNHREKILMERIGKTIVYNVAKHYMVLDC